MSKLYRLILAFSMCSLLLAGCGPRAAPKSDVQAATQLLQSVLDAWKSGEAVDKLIDRRPPIYVADELWLGGFKLTDYQMQGEGEPFGSNVRFHVTLKGTKANGGSQERKVKYLVATVPAQSVAREDR